jgi:hypothetical protein
MDKYAHLLTMNKEQQARAKKKSEHFADRMYWRKKSYLEIDKLEEPWRSKGKAFLDYYAAIQDSGNYTLAQAAASFLIYITTKTPNVFERQERLIYLINKWITKNDTRTA